MSASSFEQRGILTLLGVIAVGALACSASEATPRPPGGGSGGATSANDIKIVGSATQCPGTTPQLPKDKVTSCTSMTCKAAHCIPSAQVPPGSDTTLLGKCQDGSLCTPDDYIATYGSFLTKKCDSIDGAEGRCISTCVPRVSEQLERLPTAGCAASERCAPCYDPITGETTNACDQGCDEGPTKPKYQFAACGGARGLCVPKELVPMELQAAVPVDTCTQPNHVCAPTEKVKDINFNFPQCAPSGLATIITQPGPNGQKGGCVPGYLVADPAKKMLLLQDTCMTGELCAPCTDPLAMNAPTGACPTK